MSSHRSLKERQRQEREDLILQIAGEMLLERGYHDTSMDEIAARVGIAKGTLYLHFARKEDLMLALVERELQAFMLTVEQHQAAEGSAQSRLRSIFRVIHQGLFNKLFRLLHVLYNSPDMHTVMEENKGKLHETLERTACGLKALLDEGKAAGAFDLTIPTEVMLAVFYSLLSPRAFKRLVVEGNILPDDLVNYVERIYFKGIAAEGSAGHA